MITMILDNNIQNIKVYDRVGIDRIFIDLEVNGKHERQRGLDTVISSHCLEDIKNAKGAVDQSNILVRINPLYKNSVREINQSIENGADIIMLPMFKEVEEVELFLKLVNKRAQTCLLLETSEALARLDYILDISGIDEIHIGLNDLHLSMGVDFMFELIGGGVIEYAANKIKKKGIPFGIGGVAKMDKGVIPGEIVIKEYVRLGASRVILSRSFTQGIVYNEDMIRKELGKLHSVVQESRSLSHNELMRNKLLLKRMARRVSKNKVSS